MKIHDISLPVSESLVVWPRDPAIHITHRSHLDRGDVATVSRLD
nr:cyclase family protein [Anaerolineae bacterium]